MIDRPRLALAIPTLGRAETLEHNLRAILDEARALGVPIYISDDAPDDEETRARVGAVARDYPAIHYSRNDPTLGHDANLIKTLTGPDADWVWLLADSLMIKPGELTRIARSLGDEDFVFLNAIVPDAAAQTYRHAPSDQLLRELLWNQSLTGATIYHRRVIDWAVREKPTIHRNFPQLSIILAFASAQQVRIAWEPARTMISLPKTSYWRARSVFQNWVGDWSTVVTSYPRIFGGPSLARALSSHARGTGIFDVVNLVRYRGEGQLTAATLAMPYFREVVPTPLALIRSILLIPPAAAAAMVKARRRLRGREAAPVVPCLPARRLSIAMATYNGARFLPVQLKSFVTQSRLPDQLVVCDDGSSDETIAILEQFAKDAPFAVDIVRNPENLGHEGNFSLAMQRADGDIILLSDQDDRWDRDKLASVEQAFAEDDSALLVVNDVRMTDGDLKPTGRTLLGQLRSSGMIGLDQRGLLIGCGTSFRKELKPLILPVPAFDYGHDTWINDFAAFLGAKRVIDRPLQDYRRHQSNVSATLLEGTARATPWMIMAPSKGQDLSPDWQKRVDALDEMHRRLSALGEDRYAGLGLLRSRTAVLAEIAAARDAVVRRKTIFRKGFLGRKLLAAKMLARGDYRHFSGWRSFAKDLVR